MSIATKSGDRGTTGLPGGVRVSKADHRVDAYGTIDELISAMGFARAICADEELRALTKELQRELFLVGSAIATPPGARKPAPEIPDALVERLTNEVHRLEALDGVLGDWAIPGEDACSAAYDVARTICRRAERLAVALREEDAAIQPTALAYLNRLSDLLWLFGRVVECRLGLDAKLRTGAGPRWSRAW